MKHEEQIIQAIRDQLPSRWSKVLSDHVVRLMAIELGFLKLGPKKEFRATQRGIKFGVQRLIPREG